MIYLFSALQKLLKWKPNHLKWIFFVTIQSCFSLPSMAQFIFPLSFNVRIQRKYSFFHFQSFKSWKTNGEANGWSQESSSLCLRYKFLSHFSSWMMVCTVAIFPPFCWFKCHAHSRLSELRAKYGVHRCVIPPYKAASVCSEESLSFQMSQWSALVTVTPCLLTSD